MAALAVLARRAISRRVSRRVEACFRSRRAASAPRLMRPAAYVGLGLWSRRRARVWSCRRAYHEQVAERKRWMKMEKMVRLLGAKTCSPPPRRRRRRAARRRAARHAAGGGRARQHNWNSPALARDARLSQMEAVDFDSRVGPDDVQLLTKLDLSKDEIDGHGRGPRSPPATRWSLDGAPERLVAVVPLSGRGACTRRARRVRLGKLRCSAPRRKASTPPSSRSTGPPCPAMAASSTASSVARLRPRADGHHRDRGTSARSGHLLRIVRTGGAARRTRCSPSSSPS